MLLLKGIVMRLPFIFATLFLAAATSSQASPVSSSTGVWFNPAISAGAPPDTPGARVDANVPTSPFSGVVSINIRYDGLSFICSGTMVSPTQVLSAAHCVDTNGKGKVVDLTKPGTDVRIIFNSQPTPGDPGRAIVTATKVVIHPDYQGFGVCPFPAAFQCLNDDISIITIPKGLAPPTAKIYSIAANVQPLGAIFTQVGYGVSGDGVSGYSGPPDFRIKRTGKNTFDAFDNNDEAGFDPGSAREVWYADFDGPPGSVDRWCTLGERCGGTLGNSIETIIGGGDSGGPSFIQDGFGNYLLAGNNDFSGAFGPVKGVFGDIYGGILLGAYIPFLRSQLVGAVFIPEPETLLLMLVGIAGMATSLRRRARLVVTSRS